MNPAGINNDVDRIQVVLDKMQALVNTHQVTRDFDQIHDLTS
jgi:hypothetical protein